MKQRPIAKIANHSKPSRLLPVADSSSLQSPTINSNPPDVSRRQPKRDRQAQANLATFPAPSHATQPTPKREAPDRAGKRVWFLGLALAALATWIYPAILIAAEVAQAAPGEDLQILNVITNASPLGLLLYFEMMRKRYLNGNSANGSAHIVDALRLATKETERNGEHLQAIRESNQEIIKATLKQATICEMVQRNNRCGTQN